jgi:hypothetical protein
VTRDWKSYTCSSCGITKGAKTYEISEDGFVYKVCVCECCLEERGLDKKVIKKKDKEDGRDSTINK